MIYYDISMELVQYDHRATVHDTMRFLHELVIISFVFEEETSTMMLQPSLHRLKVLKQLEEDDTELDLGLAQLLQHRMRRRRAPRYWVRTWILRRTDFGHYDRLMHELKFEDREAFINFLRVPSELFRELEQRLTPSLLKQVAWFREALKSKKINNDQELIQSDPISI